MPEKRVVLVVDDEPFIADMITTYLGMKGYEVRGANTGQDGLTLIPLEKPDILLLDLMLPDIDGFEVCERVRAMPEFARLPVLVISARIDPQSRARAERVGADGYLTKPIKMPVLLAEVERLLSAPPGAADLNPANRQDREHEP
jgi:DNA-binding response OmpR family regulator